MTASTEPGDDDLVISRDFAEFFGALISRNVDDLAHTNRLIQENEAAIADGFAKDLLAIWTTLDRIPDYARSVQIEHLLDRYAFAAECAADRLAKPAR